MNHATKYSPLLICCHTSTGLPTHFHAVWFFTLKVHISSGAIHSYSSTLNFNYKWNGIWLHYWDVSKLKISFKRQVMPVCTQLKSQLKKFSFWNNFTDHLHYHPSGRSSLDQAYAHLFLPVHDQTLVPNLVNNSLLPHFWKRRRLFISEYWFPGELLSLIVGFSLLWFWNKLNWSN